MSSTIVKFGFLPVKRTVFLLCDVQEKFRTAAMYFQEIIQSSNKLVSVVYFSVIVFVFNHESRFTTTFLYSINYSYRRPKSQTYHQWSLNNILKVLEELLKSWIQHMLKLFSLKRNSVWLQRTFIKSWIHYVMVMCSALSCLVLRCVKQFYFISKFC